MNAEVFGKKYWNISFRPYRPTLGTVLLFTLFYVLVIYMWTAVYFQTWKKNLDIYSYVSYIAAQPANTEALFLVHIP